MSDVSGYDYPPQSGDGTIVVIEPDILVRMTVAEYLRECGYKVVVGVGADDVFLVLEAGHPIDVVLAAINLPGGFNGFALARRIRQDHPGIEVILTASEARAAEEAADLCDDGPLPKPYHPREVVRRINLLRARRGGTQIR